MVVEVEVLERTDDGGLRNPVFRGLSTPTKRSLAPVGDLPLLVGRRRRVRVAPGDAAIRLSDASRKRNGALGGRRSSREV
jgi:hypothetical protein